MPGPTKTSPALSPSQSSNRLSKDRAQRLSEEGKENIFHLALSKRPLAPEKPTLPTSNSQLLMDWEHGWGWCKQCDRYFKGEGSKKVRLKLMGDWPNSWLVDLPPFSSAVVFSHAVYWTAARSGISLVVLVGRWCGGHRCSTHIHRDFKTNRA